ncbi:MAG: DUF2306 domain-containing protein [Hyphomicrobiaceae bacterium]
MQNPILRPWHVPMLLISLSLIPFAATTNRLISLIHADPVAPDSAMTRYGGDWGMLVGHILIGCLFLILAAFQFSPELRVRYRLWHRVSGKIAMVAGITAGLSGIWLVLAYPPSPLATLLMDALRVLFGAALAGSIVLAFLAICRRDVPRHRAWMIRAFSIAVAGSTQALVIGLWLAAAQKLTPDSATVLIGLGFVINLAVAEWCIRAPSRITAMQITVN